MKPLVSNRTLAMLKARMDSTFTASATIKKQSDARGTMGEPLHEMLVVAEDVPCRVIRAGANTQGMARTTGSQESITDRYRVILGATVALDVDYEIHTGGAVYQVVMIDDNLTDKTSTACICVRAR